MSNNEFQQFKQPQQLEKNPGNRTKVIVSIGVAAALAGFGASRFLESNKSPEPAANPTAEALVTPGVQAETTPAVEPTIDTPSTDPTNIPEFTPESGNKISDFEIPAGLGVGEYSERFMTAISSWTMQGTNKETFDKILSMDIDEGDSLLAEQLSQTADEFADTLFTTNWRDDETLVAFVEKTQTYNYDHVKMWFQSYVGSTQYESSEELIGSELIAESNGQRMIEITYRHNDNKEAIPRLDRVESEDGSIYTLRCATSVVDGVERIISITAV